MKTYWHIPGWRYAHRHDGDHCIMFDKFDGNNIRIEWSRKRGWYKFGTRTILIDETSEYGIAIRLFHEKYADALDQVIRCAKTTRSIQNAVGFFELHGPNSFCGIHVPGDPLTVTLFDFDLDKRGIMLPRQFVDTFGHLDIPRILYEGPFCVDLITEVRAGMYPATYEGGVCKGVNRREGRSDQHGLWMAKIKTERWLQDLKARALADPNNVILRQAMQENATEQ